MCSQSKSLLLASFFALLIGVGAVGFTHPEYIGLPGEPKVDNAPAPVQAQTNVAAVAAPQVKATAAKSGCGSSGNCCCAAKAKKCSCGGDSTTAKVESTLPVTTVRNIGLLSSPHSSFVVVASLTMAPVVETK